MKPTLRQLCALLAVFLSTSSALADTLYGLTYDGYLLAIDKTNATVTQVRGKLPSTYGTFGSLEYTGGYFYTTYSLAHADQTRNGGNILRFGFITGDETPIWNTGVPIVKGLGAAPSGQLYASMSATQSSGATYGVIAVMNLGNLTYALQPGRFGTTEPYGETRYQYLTDITFKDNATQYAISTEIYTPSGQSPQIYTNITRSGYYNNQWNYAAEGGFQIPLSGATQGLAFDRSTSDTLYMITGYGNTQLVGPYRSDLYKLVDNNGGFANTYVGTVNGGFQGVVGLTFSTASSPCASVGIPYFNSVENATISTAVTYKGGVEMAGGNFGHGDFVIGSGANVQFIGGYDVHLAPGFSVQNGGVFSAVVDPYVCTS